MAALKRKKDRRSPEKRAEENRLRKEYHWLDCKACGRNGAEFDKTVAAFTCWRCIVSMVAPPEALKDTPTKKYAKYKANPLFTHGWWKKVLFKAEHDGETLYFQRGKLIDEAKYKSMLKALDG
jgi:hypothetical protein